MSLHELVIEPGLLARDPAPPDAAGGVLVLCDGNTEALLPPAWASLPRHVIAPGEDSKSWDELGRLLGALDRAGIDRDGHLLALGGGVVTDLGGLAAALHRRGVRWTAVPTSLVGQVDAAVGGKTAVNLGGGKNTVGLIHPAAAVLVDCAALASLPQPHLRAGLAEVLKTALIAGPALLQDVEALQLDTLTSDPERSSTVVAACLSTKLALVADDLHDHGERRKLNLGHTFGHAFEALCMPDLLHGEAVGLGLLCAARLAAGDPGSQLEQRISGLLQRWGLPTRIALAPGAVLAEMGRDKKRKGGALTAVLVHAPGRVVVREGVPAAALEAALGAVLAPI